MTPSTDEEWKEHFESLPVDSLLEMLVVSGTQHKDIIRDVLRNKGISDEERADRIMKIRKAKEEPVDLGVIQDGRFIGPREAFLFAGAAVIVTMALLVLDGGRIWIVITENVFALFQYMLLAITVFSFAVSWYIFHFFLVGGELPLIVTSESGRFFLYRRASALCAAVTVILSIVRLDVFVSVLAFCLAIVLTFLGLSLLSNVTDGRASVTIRNNVLYIWRVGFASAVMFVITLIMSVRS